MPRFVILRHELPPGAQRGLHWDLMLESGDALRTWALSGEPGTAGAVDAEQLADHRLAYLDYEGPVANDRGSVTRWDWGDYELVEDDLQRWSVIVCGQRLKGQVVLERCEPAGHSWRVSFGAVPMSS